MSLAADATSAASAPAPHWAYQPVQNVEPPAVADAAWAVGPIDRFLLASLEAKGLKPAPQADKRTLLRRATFDLTGLPPTPEEIRAFLDDTSPDAFAKVVDRLLASPRYGERWGRHWLDVVRYADTAGDGADYPAPEAYRYRDYVIDAFNSDKPYDQFLREQIAGDILAKQSPDETYAQKVIATGFLAVSKRFGYHFQKHEFRHLDIADTIEVLGRSVLGLSIGCARCHDHKHDQISIADYYGLYGIFDSSLYSFPGGEEHKRPEYLEPIVPPDQRQAIEAEQKQRLAELDAKIAEAGAQTFASIDGGAADLAFEMQELNTAPAAPWYTAGPNVISFEAQSPYTNVYPSGVRGVRMGNGQNGDGIRQSIDPPQVASAADGQVLHFNVDFRNVDAIEGGGSYRFYLGQGFISSLAIELCASSTEFVLRNGDAFEPVRPLQTGVWYNLRLALDLKSRTYSGAIGTPGDWTEFKDKAFHPAWNGTIDTFFIDGTGHVAGNKPAHDIDNLAWRSTPIDAPTEATQPDPNNDRHAELRKHLPEQSKLLAELRRQRAEVAARNPFPSAYAVVEGPSPADAKIQLRGEPGNPGEVVPRRFLEVLGGDTLPPGAAGSGRLQLADWLTRPTNPLTARVMVNRIWQYHFGQGLVRTPSDFGARGEPPTHPALLDHLARQFVDGGWSVKAMHRQIMLSRAYQMAGDGTSAADQSAARAADPENLLLWHFPRRRLDAEEVRDAMLAISGNLDLSPAGPHPFPPVEQWTYTIHAPFYAVYESNRRSVYLMVQRQKKHPFLSLFDGADPNISNDGRLVTTTPKQALFLMNDPFVHEQSAGLARRLIAEHSDEPARIRAAMELTQAREPAADEHAAAADFLRRYREALAALGKSADEQEQMAWSAYARVLLTGNGFLFVD